MTADAEREAKVDPREVLADVMKLIEDGFLVRDTSRDASPGWAIRSLPMVMTLARAKVCLATPSAETIPPREQLAARLMREILDITWDKSMHTESLRFQIGRRAADYLNAAAPERPPLPADALREALAELLLLVETETNHGRRGTEDWVGDCAHCAACDRAAAALAAVPVEGQEDARDTARLDYLDRNGCQTLMKFPRHGQTLVGWRRGFLREAIDLAIRDCGELDDIAAPTDVGGGR